MTSAPTALVFDLDGTLVDSRADIAAATNATLAAFGRPALPAARVASFVGDGARVLLARAFDLPSDARELDAALVTFHARYLAEPCARTTLLPGVRDALELGCTNLLVTNKPREIALLLLDALGLAEAFAAVFAGGDGPLKPSPAGVLEVLRRAGRAPGEAWVVGDGPQDVRAGKAAGCLTVAIPGIADPDALRSEEPDVIVASLVELAAMIKGAR